MVEPVLQGRAEGIDGEVDDGHHDEDEDGDGGPLARQDAVDAAAALVFFTFLGFDDGFTAELLDKGETHLCHRCGTVEATFLFHLHDEVLKGLFLVL